MICFVGLRGIIDSCEYLLNYVTRVHVQEAHINLTGLSVVQHLSDGWAWFENVVHMEVGGAMTKLEGGLVTRLVEQEEVG